MNPRRRPLRRMQQVTKTYSVVPEWFQHIGQDTSPNNPNYKVLYATIFKLFSLLWECLKRVAQGPNFDFEGSYWTVLDLEGLFDVFSLISVILKTNPKLIYRIEQPS